MRQRSLRPWPDPVAVFPVNVEPVIVNVFVVAAVPPTQTAPPWSSALFPVKVLSCTTRFPTLESMFMKIALPSPSSPAPATVRLFVKLLDLTLRSPPPPNEIAAPLNGAGAVLLSKVTAGEVENVACVHPARIAPPPKLPAVPPRKVSPEMLTVTSSAMSGLMLKIRDPRRSRHNRRRRARRRRWW